MDSESRSDEFEPTETLLERLDKLVQEYVMQTFRENGDYEEGDYVASWAIVANYGNINEDEGMALGYFVDMMPQKNPPHATKGLFREGIDWVNQAQEGAFKDDE